MSQDYKKPREYDAVLGAQQPQAPINGVVLGGIEGVKRRLASTDVEQKIIALEDALKYGAAGLEIVVQALQDKYSKVQQAAYLLLYTRQEPLVQQALHEYKTKNNRFEYFVALAQAGGVADVDKLMDSLENDFNSATCKLVDYALGLVKTNEGKERIKHYLFNGTQTQRNYAALYFKRKGARDILLEAVNQGCIDKVQAFSK